MKSILIALCFISYSTTYKLIQYKGTLQSSSNDIVVIGDTQKTSFWGFWRENNDSFREVVFNKIAEDMPSAILHLGDIIFQGDSKSHWEDFNHISLNVKDIPIYPVLGNHEYYGNNNDALANYFNSFPNIQQWYFRIINSIGFIFLNSNFSELSKKEIEKQSQWLKTTLAYLDTNSLVRSVVLLSHQPPFTNSKTVNDDLNVQKYFLRSFNASKKANLFLSGHSHSYEHFFKNGKHYVISGGGGGPRQKVDISSDKKHRDLFNYNEIRPLHYLKIKLKENYLMIQMIAWDGYQWKKEDEFDIYHSNYISE